ncbi:MAG: hypothetical protein NW224_04050, partial [Leptolyngbyaceae cyanobacterium bins.302]|nr:hypothetical protein [Leptolyngbyaceae cyanobacterium bins.302]
MNALDLVSQQRQKEQKILKLFLISSLISSVAFHAGAMTLRVGNYWSDTPLVEESEIEVTVTEDALEDPVKE